VRTATRKAVKNGLRVSWVDSTECWQDFGRIYIAAMEQLEAERFYFFSNDYFCSLLGWQQSQLAFCLKEDNLLAAALFLRGSHIMEYHLAAANGEGKRLSASNLLLDRAATRARELGCRKLHLGGGTDNRPDNPLLFFKSSFSQDRRLDGYRPHSCSW
jgi:serine/alanine adding enzyme